MAEETVYKIIQAQSSEEIDAAKLLFLEYAKWLDVDLYFQNFDDELASLPGKYSPPQGRLYLVVLNDEYSGCIALRKLEEGICEMKRLYLRSELRGKGIGKKLVSKIIQDAKDIGYKKMRLDTIKEKMPNAVKMYELYGFVEIEGYYNNPNPHTLYMELNLTN